VHRARGGGRRRGGGRAAHADRPRPNVKFGFFVAAAPPRKIWRAAVARPRRRAAVPRSH